jgi:hypothetical protein
MKTYIPSARVDLDRLINLLKNEEPFCFVRFSDGEITILRNNYLEIKKGITHFRGRTFKNNYKNHDIKKFDPVLNQEIRRDLLSSAIFRKKNYFKGVPATHNNQIEDRDFMIRLNGGMTDEITFADLLMNSNFLDFNNKMLPIISKKKLAIIGNFRGKPDKIFAHAEYIPIQDNFFENYVVTLNGVVEKINLLPEKTVVISSASSLSNIVGWKIFNIRPDITFIDVGTAINSLIGIKGIFRAYQSLLSDDPAKIAKYKKFREFLIKW